MEGLPTFGSRNGLWLPEAEVIVGAANPLRQLVYLSNWLHVRNAIRNRLTKRPLYLALSSSHWRTFLDRFPPKNEEEKQAAERAKRSGADRHAKAKAENTKSRPHKKKKTPPTAANDAPEKSKRYLGRLATLEYFSRWLDIEVRDEPEPIAAFNWQGVTIPLDIEGARLAAPQRNHTTTAGSSRMSQVSPHDHAIAHGAALDCGGAATPDTIPPRPAYEAPPAWALRQVAWEVTELAFRAELYELDRRLVGGANEEAMRARDALIEQVFPSAHHWMTPTLPPPIRSLSATRIQERVACLEALRQLLIRWPEAPHTLREVSLTSDVPEGVATQTEVDLATFYCRCALKEFGRPPVIPRQFSPQARGGSTVLDAPPSAI